MECRFPPRWTKLKLCATPNATTAQKSLPWRPNAKRSIKRASPQREKLFVDGPVLVLPAAKEFNFTFDPNAVLALDDKLTLYEGEIKVTDEWGVLKTTEGVVIVRENGRFVCAQVPAPADLSKTPLAGTGWTLTLKPDWQAVPEGRPGDLALKRKSTP